jgi:hypothetical protein
MVIIKTIDRLREMEARLRRSSSCEEAYPILVVKWEFEEEVRTLTAELNRLAGGWTYMGPLQGSRPARLAKGKS